MPKKLVTRKMQRDYRGVLEQVIQDMSQPVIILQDEDRLFVVCPNCIWDSINKKSSNIFNASFIAPVIIFSGTDQQRTITPQPFSFGRCPVCFGEGQLFTENELSIPALVNWYIIRRTEHGDYTDLPAGKQGLHYAQIKAKYAYYELLRQNRTFIIFGDVKCEKFIAPFVRGLGSDIAIVEMWVETVEPGESVTGIQSGHTGRNIDPRVKIKGPTELQIMRDILKGNRP